MELSTRQILHLCTIAGIKIDLERSNLSEENMNAEFVLSVDDGWFSAERKEDYK